MLERLQKLLGNDYEIREVTTKKNNCYVHGISIRKKDECIAPIFEYEMFKDDPEGLVQTYLEIAAENAKLVDYKNQYMDPCWMKEHVYLRLTSDAKYAEEFLNRRIADLYLIPYIQFDEDYITNIKPDYLKIAGITEEEIFSIAMRNMDKDCALYSMDDIVFCAMFGYNNSELPNYMEEELECNIPMITVTNHSTKLGAASILCKRIQERLNEIFSEGYYLIPSSIHEFLAIDKEIHTPESLKEMISGINRDKIDEKDRLSDAAYYIENGMLLKTIM